MSTDFEKGVKALEDLYQIGGATLAPMLNRVYYHFSRAENKRESEKALPEVKSFLEKSTIELIKDYMAFSGSSVQFVMDYTEYHLEEWNRLLEVLPAALATINSFRYGSAVTVKFTARGISFGAKLAEMDDYESLRPMIYRNLRSILSRNSILTFEIAHGEISFYLDFTYGEDEVFAIDLNDNFHNLTLCLPAICANYVSDCKLESEHTVIEINEHLELKRHSRIPDQLDREMEILHFSFLFRPVSIIIPRRGKLLPIDNSSAAGDPGSGNVFEGFTKAGLYYLDLFALMSN